MLAPRRDRSAIIGTTSVVFAAGAGQKVKKKLILKHRQRRMMASLELPHWLVIAGALLVVAGFIGVIVSRKKVDEVDPPPDEPTDTPRQQMPPLPSLLDSRTKTNA
jgi:hypothetical protein